jgi:hypothetical protein
MGLNIYELWIFWEHIPCFNYQECFRTNIKLSMTYEKTKIQGHTFVVKVHKLNMVFPMEFTSS